MDDQYANRVREAARVGYNAFLDAIDEDTRAEWVDGEVEFMSSISRVHQRIGWLLMSLFADYLKRWPIGEVYYESFQMKTGPDLPGREPDILFIRNENLDRVHETYIDGPGDLVVEIVSPDSVRRDREQKFREYAAGGVPEYWIIDTVRGVSEFYLLAGGAYQPAPLSDNGLFASVQLPGLRVNPDWLRQDPLPTAKSVLVEAGIASTGLAQ